MLLAFSTFSFIWAWNKQESHGWLYAVFISLGVLFVYNFDAIRQFQNGMKQGQKRNWFEKNIFINKYLMLVAMISLIYFAFSEPVFTILIAKKMLILIGLYVFYAFFNGRQIPMLKMWIVAFSWAFAVSVPFYFFSFLKLFLLFLSLAIFSDCKDLDFDENKIKTLPQIMGIQSAKWMGLLLYFCFIALEFYPNNLNALSLGAVSILFVYLLLFHVSNIQKKFLSLIDSTLIILALALLFE